MIHKKSVQVTPEEVPEVLIKVSEILKKIADQYKLGIVMFAIDNDPSISHEEEGTVITRASTLLAHNIDPDAMTLLGRNIAKSPPAMRDSFDEGYTSKTPLTIDPMQPQDKKTLH